MPAKSEKMQKILENQRKVYQSENNEIENLDCNIQNINIEELSDKELAQMCFHYSLKKDKSSIDRNGLQTKIGRNSEGIDNLKSIYFSYGIEGVLETWDVWLKWRANRLGNPHWQEENKEVEEAIKNGTIAEQEKKEYWYKCKLWNEEFTSGRYKEDKEKIDFLYDFQMEEMQASNYYILDLKEGEDFSFDEIDIKKQANLALKDNPNNMSYQMFLEIYGKCSDFDSEKVDKWNMNTFLGKEMTIGVERIKQLELADGRDDVLSIVTYLYDKYKEITTKDKQVEFDLLDGYIEHTKEKLKEGQKSIISETDIGKTTINTDTESKDMAKAQVQRDLQKMQEKGKTDDIQRRISYGR